MKVKAEINKLGYRAISNNLQEALFPDFPDGEEINLLDVAKIARDLEQFDMEFPKDQTEDELDLPFLPDLKGKEPIDFIKEDACRDFEVIKQKLDRFSNFRANRLPSRRAILKHPYWVKYPYSSINSPYPVEGIEEDVMVFDAETYVKVNSYPVMASALTREGYYLWLHPALCNYNLPFTRELVKVGEGKVIVNHEVAYDLARVHETYTVFPDKPNYSLDTKSMHIAVQGIGDKLKYAWEKYSKGGANYAADWCSVTTGSNDLVSVYNLHVKPDIPLSSDDKAIRNVFVTGDMQDFRDQLLDLAYYNFLDVKYTFELFKVLWPKFLYFNPEIFTLAGILEVTNALLPVVKNWDQWVHNTNKIYTQTATGLNKKLTKLAEDLEEDFISGKLTYEEIAKDPWLSSLDWTPAKSGKSKGHSDWFRKGVINARTAKKKKGDLLWENPVSTSSNLTPILLKLEWDNSPLVYHKTKKWCYVCNKDKIGAFKVESKKLPYGVIKDNEEGDYYLCKVPHPKGDSENCGNPLGKAYIGFVDSGVMSSSHPNAIDFLKGAKSISYWKSMQSRIESYNAIKANDIQATLIKPQITAMGTITRRAVEYTWLVAGDSKPDKIGSELKSRIQAPSGTFHNDYLDEEDSFILLGADFTSQEMRIGAAKADNIYGIHGSSAMSLTQMVGSKKNKTDSHSLLSSYLDDIGRQVAKTLNFLMLFFGGNKGCASGIKAHKPTLSDAETKELADRALTLRRGKKQYNNGSYRYVGGTDSHAYNFMLDLAESDENRTVLGKSAISLPLQKAYAGKENLPSRCNRGIQSAGVDLLHCFVPLYHYLCKKYKVKSRFILSIHDEVWTLSSYKQRYLAAYLFQLTHMFIWSAFFRAYGFTSIPYNYLFFDSVNLDKVVRKECVQEEGEPSISTNTPSNLEEVIEDGEGLTMKDIVNKLSS
jgi:DNA polymerase gamma 1